MLPPAGADPLVIAAAACFTVRKKPVRLVARTRSQSDRSVTTIGAAAPVPAAATQMSSRPPPLVKAASTAALTSSSSATSHAMARARSAGSSAKALSSRSLLRPAMVTVAPSRARMAAQARPMPLPPPVINADWLVRAATLMRGPGPSADRGRHRPPRRVPRPTSAAARPAPARTWRSRRR